MGVFFVFGGGGLVGDAAGFAIGGFFIPNFHA
jgi:hypothetical protein